MVQNEQAVHTAAYPNWRLRLFKKDNFAMHSVFRELCHIKLRYSLYIDAAKDNVFRLTKSQLT